MKGFVVLTAAVLVAIGIGVGVLARTGSSLGPVGTVAGRAFLENSPAAGYAPLELVPPFQGPVSLRNVASGIEFTASSDSEGHFSLTLPPGTYRVLGGSGLYVFPSRTVRVVTGKTTVVSVCFGCNLP